jgi:ribonucleotide reductase beta subunit family protein with ferritin-like domain
MLTRNCTTFRKTGNAANPPWLDDMLNGVEHANFFETRSTEYAKASTTGNEDIFK